MRLASPRRGGQARARPEKINNSQTGRIISKIRLHPPALRRFPPGDGRPARRHKCRARPRLGERSPPAAGTIDRFIHQGARKRMRTLPRRWHLDRCRFTLKRRAARAFRLSIASGAPTPPAPRLVLPASGTRTQTESLPRSAALSLATDLVGAPSAPLMRRHPQLDQPVDDCVGLIFVVGGRMPTRLSPSRVEPRPSAHSLSPSRQPAARDRLDDLERDDRARAAPFSKSPSICPI